MSGKYVVYLKAYYDSKGQSSLRTYLSANSKSLISFSHSERPLKEMLRLTLLSHAEQNSECRVKLGQNWVQTRILYEECGLAYILVSVAEHSSARIEVKIDEEDFKREGFILLKPYRGKGDVTVEVQCAIRKQLIIARVDTSERRELQFPPSSVTIVEK